MNKLNVAVVGLSFGGSFVPIYLDHPNINTLGVFDVNRELVNTFLEKYPGISKAYDSFESLLEDKSLEAVHLVTPIPLHADQTVRVLESGKHCACTVPMATSLEDIRRICDAVKKTGKNYMMMETTLYTYQFFYVKELIEIGKLGRIQFLRGSHYQDMVNWPDYWMGLPPMWYGTHAIGPMVALSGSRICRVNCFGSGVMEEGLHKQYGNPFPIESALFEFENGLKGEATRSLFETSRGYQEGLFVYGSKASFEWGLLDHEPPYLTTPGPLDPKRRGRPYNTEKVEPPNYHRYLPEPIQKYTVGSNYDATNPQESLKKGAGAGHHGSHPHLVNEFMMSVVEKRKPRIDHILGGNITAAGICAHESAMKNGEAVVVPTF